MKIKIRNHSHFKHEFFYFLYLENKAYMSYARETKKTQRMFQQKNLLLLIILSLILQTNISAHAAETKPLNAGFVNTLWYSSNDFILGEKVRIYSAIQNQSPFDLVGEIKLFDNDKEVQKNSLSIAEGTLVHNWFDLTITTGTHKIYEVFTNTKISKVESGVEPVPIRSQTSTIEQKNSTPKIPSPSTPENTNSNTTSSITQNDPQTLTASSDAQTRIKNTSTSDSNFSSSSKTIINKTSTETKNFITSVTGGLIETLKKQKEILDEENKAKNNHQPVPLLADAAKQVEQKNTWFKIPQEKIPSYKQLLSWLLAATIYLVGTWWFWVIMLIILLKLLWKIIHLLRA